VNFIYLDHNATTPLHPEVLAAMLPLLRDSYGNPSSIHGPGRTARVRLDEARERVAQLINARPGEMVFTSGGTEANNLAVKGVALALRDKGKHILTTQVEHASVLNPCRDLAALGFEPEFLPVDQQGRLDPERLERALREDTVLVSVQYANNEVGTLQDIVAVGRMARARGVLFHVDAVQAVGKIPVDVEQLPVDLLSVSAHKIQGPKGVGALYIRRGSPALMPLVSGGGQEKKRRGGTENLPGIVGFGKAAELAQEHLRGRGYLQKLRDGLWERIRAAVAGADLLGHPHERLPNTLSVVLEGVDGETVLIGLDVEGVAVSTGAACSSGSLMPSHVLTAMQVPVEKINASLRFSLGWDTTEGELVAAVEILRRVVERARSVTPARG
jgi:cysteine desulfurase